MEYKIGDMFEVLIKSNSFEKGDVITLERINGDCYYFKENDHTFYYTIEELTGNGERTQFAKYIEKFTYEIY